MNHDDHDQYHDLMSRLVDYHDHISAPSVHVADDLSRGRRRVRRNRGLLSGGVALGLASVIAAVSLFTGDRATDRPQPAGPPGLTTTFVSPTYGYSVGHLDRWSIAPATELWDPGDEQLDDMQFSDRFDGVETGESAYFVGASTEIPDGVSIEDWYDEYVSPSGCGVPRSQQPKITIDGQSGRIAECPSQIEATVVAGGRLYLFMLSHQRSDARAYFDAWVATIDLTPETAAAPKMRPSNASVLGAPPMATAQPNHERAFKEPQ